ncbi:MAG: SDR family oxidoreductase [Acidimicrobiales bacterium]
MTWDISDKQVLITGGTSGIGRATGAELARRGASVTVTSRKLASAEAAAVEISRDTNSKVAAAELDLSSLKSVRHFSSRYAAANDRLDLLINNAGSIAGRYRTTADGFEWTLGVNHLGPFLLTNLLIDLLETSAPSRVINVSSENHRGAKNGLDFADLQMTNGYGSSRAYAASKLANILFTVELDRRFRDRDLTARALHPGVVATNFGKDAGSPRWMGVAMTLLKPFLSTPEKGAATSVHLATARTAELDLGIYWSGRKPKQPSAQALDNDAALKLWDLSAELVGLSI